MSVPCGRFRAAVRWLQVGTQLACAHMSARAGRELQSGFATLARGRGSVREGAPASRWSRLTSLHSKPSIVPSLASSVAGTSSRLIMSYVLGTTCRVNAYNLWWDLLAKLSPRGPDEPRLSPHRAPRHNVARSVGAVGYWGRPPRSSLLIREHTSHGWA